MSLPSRVIDRTVKQPQVELEGEWFDSGLIAVLTGMRGWYSYDGYPGVTKTEGVRGEQLAKLETMGMCSWRYIGGGFFGTAKLTQLVGNGDEV